LLGSLHGTLVQTIQVPIAYSQKLLNEVIHSCRAILPGGDSWMKSTSHTEKRGMGASSGFWESTPLMGWKQAKL
jgi:hypothetical protein